VVSTQAKQATISTIPRLLEEVQVEFSIREDLLIPSLETNISIITTAICPAIREVLELTHQTQHIKHRNSRDHQIVAELLKEGKITLLGAEII